MATMRDIKRRKASIESTEQITKAMKLVATVKLQKSRTRAENSRLYFNMMYRTIQNAGIADVMPFLSGEFDKSGFGRKPGFSLTTIVGTEQRSFPVVKINHQIVIDPADQGIRREDEMIFHPIERIGCGKLFIPFDRLGAVFFRRKGNEYIDDFMSQYLYPGGLIFIAQRDCLALLFVVQQSSIHGCVPCPFQIFVNFS